jgi:hypothetical protein
MTTNLLAAGQSAIERPSDALDIVGVEEDQLAGRSRMICTRARRYRERPVKPRYGARADKAAVEPEPRDERGRYGRG